MVSPPSLSVIVLSRGIPKTVTYSAAGFPTSLFGTWSPPENMCCRGLQPAAAPSPGAPLIWPLSAGSGCACAPGPGPAIKALYDMFLPLQVSPPRGTHKLHLLVQAQWVRGYAPN